jgi:hypothetical protein
MKGKSLSNGVIHLSLKVRRREVLREIILIAAKTDPTHSACAVAADETRHPETQLIGRTVRRIKESQGRLAPVLHVHKYQFVIAVVHTARDKG